MTSFTGKNVVITGAGSGIGRALAVRFSLTGANLALCDISADGLGETVQLIKAANVNIVSERVDVSSQADMERFARLVETRLGGADIVINNAGVSLTQMAEEMPKSNMEWLFGINFWGVIHGCTAYMPQLRTRTNPHLVNISSLFGLIPMASQSAYVASKFAVRGYTESLRLELAHTSIKVHCVHPGGIDTGIVRNGRHFSASHGLVDPAALAKDFKSIARTSPDQAAAKIIAGIASGNPRILIGTDAILLDLLQRLAPRGIQRLLMTFQRLVDRRALRLDEAIPKGPNKAA